MPELVPGSGDLTVLCKVHNRRVMLHATPGYPPRLMHMSRAGTPAEFCESQLFLARYEVPANRNQALAELLARGQAGNAAVRESTR